jgi:hypothetical protein
VPSTAVVRQPVAARGSFHSLVSLPYELAEQKQRLHVVDAEGAAALTG